MFQRGSDGRWVAQISQGPRTARTITRRYAKSRQEAEAALEDLLTTLPSLAERFWSHVDRTGECWEWTGERRHGYGYFWNGVKPVRAHRFAWELVNGPIPVGLAMLHACDNPPCVNPAHLRPGTQLENMADRRRHAEEAA